MQRMAKHRDLVTLADNIMSCLLYTSDAADE